MKAKFPFHKQETCYTCGAAATRMALEFVGIKKSERQVVKILGTNKIRGTWHRGFPIVAEKFKLIHVSMRNSKIEDLKRYQKDGFAVILCYFLPTEKVDHYSVLKNIDKKFIYFWDPWFGPDHKYSLKYFNNAWKSDPRYDNEKHWFFAIKNNNYV